MLDRAELLYILRTNKTNDKIISRKRKLHKVIN